MDTYIRYNIKPISSELVYEDALFLKYKIRQLRDVSTDAFIETFFNYSSIQSETFNKINDRARKIFLLYIYDIFKLQIIAYFNKYLLENNTIILYNSTEYIDFIFKGGNIMFIYIYEELSTNPELKEKIFTNNDLLNMLNECFKVSDFDFTIYLKCINYTRFYKIKPLLIKFIISILENINIFFNNYLTDVLVNDRLYFNNNNLSFNKLDNDDIYPDETEYIESRININDFIANNLDRTQNNIIKILYHINNLLANIVNNNLSDNFIKQVIINDELNIFYNKTFYVDINKYCIDENNINILNINITKISSIIKEIINYIVSINLQINNQKNGLIKLLNNDIIKNCNILKANIINVFGQIIFLNTKYLGNIFIIPQNILDIYNTCIDNLTNYFRTIEEYIISINFYNPKYLSKIFTKISNIFEEKLKYNNIPITPIIEERIIERDENNIIQNINIYKNIVETENISKIFYSEPSNNNILLFNNENDYYMDNNYEQIKLPIENVINDKSFFFMSNDNSIIQIDVFYENIQYINYNINNFHYLTFNSTINTVKHSYKAYNKFDLLRIKLNIIYNDSLYKNVGDIEFINKPIKIPSEFIDISISDIEDTFSLHYKNHRDYNKSVYNLNLENSIITVESYSPEYIIYDLQGVLYFQNSFMPWTDIKYEKRLKRLLFIFAINNDLNLIYLKVLLNMCTLFIDYIDYTQKYNNNNYFITNYEHLDKIYNYLFKIDSMTYLEDIRKYNCINIKNKFFNKLNYLISKQQNIFNHYFGNEILYGKNLDELLNTTIILFLFYISYNHTNIIQDTYTNNKLILKIINIIRFNFNLAPYKDEEELYNNFIKKILEYFDKLFSILTTITKI